MIAAVFQNPMMISSLTAMWLLLPICTAVAVIYKTVRVEHLRNIPREVIVLMIYMVVGLTVLGGALWAVQKYWP